jgi:D-inositol-3-phosphate glycosyltransferase
VRESAAATKDDAPGRVVGSPGPFAPLGSLSTRSFPSGRVSHPGVCGGEQEEGQVNPTVSGSNSKRLAYVGAVPPLRGGIAQHGANLVSALRDRGHEVRVYSWQRQYPRLLYPGQRQREPQTGVLPGATYPLRWWDPLSWMSTGRMLERFAPDGVILPWVTPFQALALKSVAATAGCRNIVMLVHNLEPHERQPLTRPLTRWMFKGARGALVHSTTDRNALERMGIDLAVEVAAHPPNIGCEPTPPPSSPPFRLLFLGYVRPYKGVATLVNAMGALRRNGVDVRLTIAGEVWDGGEELRELIAREQADDVVHLRDEYIPDEEVPRLLQDHHTLVAPYRSATQSGVIPLALAAGRPVVATRVGGLVEQVRHMEDGVLVEPDDAEALAEAVQLVAERWSEMSRLAELHVPTWEDVARKVESLVG